uniref:mTERF domain-containing protein 1, mitochondrial n=1 Tax=Amphimedon queenslandica TaxID=400682 RepID=A0A1X7UYR1_AMPQE
MATIIRVFSLWRLSCSAPVVSTRYSRTPLSLLLTDGASPAIGYYCRGTRKVATAPAISIELKLRDKERKNIKVKADSSSVGARSVPRHTSDRSSSQSTAHEAVTGNKKQIKYRKPKLAVDQLKASIQKRKNENKLKHEAKVKHEGKETKLKHEAKDNKRAKKEMERQAVPHKPVEVDKVRTEAPPTAPPTGFSRESAQSAKLPSKQSGKSQQVTEGAKPKILPKDLAKALLELKGEKKDTGERTEEKNGDLKENPSLKKKKNKKVKISDSTYLDHSKWRPHLSDYHRHEQEELVTQLQEKFKLDLSSFKSHLSHPSVIGTSIPDIDQRIKSLTEAGFSETEVASIVPSIPFIIEVDWKRFYKVCQVFDEFGINWGTFLEQKYISNLVIGTRCIEVLEKNLATLKKIGFESSKMAEILFENPILLSCPMSDQVYRILAEAAGFGFNIKWIRSILIKALTSRPVKVAALTPNTPKVMKILSDLGIPPEFMMTSYPPFFLIDDTHLYSIIRILSTAPLYLDTSHIVYLIRSCPQDVASIKDLKGLQQKLTDFKDLLSPVLNMSDVLMCFHKIPSFVNQSHSISGTVSLFEGFGFSFEEARHVISKSPTILVQDKASLRHRIELFLSLKNSKPLKTTHVFTHPLMNFTKTDEFFTSRFNYTQRHNPSLLDASKAAQIFSGSDESFAALFGSTATSYIEEAVKAEWISPEYGQHRLKLHKKGN